MSLHKWFTVTKREAIDVDAADREVIVIDDGEDEEQQPPAPAPPPQVATAAATREDRGHPPPVQSAGFHPVLAGGRKRSRTDGSDDESEEAQQATGTGTGTGNGSSSSDSLPPEEAERVQSEEEKQQRQQQPSLAFSSFATESSSSPFSGIRRPGPALTGQSSFVQQGETEEDEVSKEDDTSPTEDLRPVPPAPLPPPPRPTFAAIHGGTAANTKGTGILKPTGPDGFYQGEQGSANPSADEIRAEYRRYQAYEEFVGRIQAQAPSLKSDVISVKLGPMAFPCCKFPLEALFAGRPTATQFTEKDLAALAGVACHRCENIPDLSMLDVNDLVSSELQRIVEPYDFRKVNRDHSPPCPEEHNLIIRLLRAAMHPPGVHPSACLASVELVGFHVDESFVPRCTDVVLKLRTTTNRSNNFDVLSVDRCTREVILCVLQLLKGTILDTDSDTVLSQEEVDNLTFVDNIRAYCPHVPTEPKKILGRWAMKVPEDLNELPNVILSPSITMQPHPHQVQSIAWMLRRERQGTREKIKAKLTIGNAPYTLFWNPLTMESSLIETQKLRTNPQWEEELNPTIRGGILADEMGLGKTLSLLTVMAMNPPPQDAPATVPLSCRLPLRPSDPPEVREAINGRGHLQCIKATLVVLPVSLFGQWRSEIQRAWPSAAVLQYHGPERHRFSLADFRKADVVLTTYETLRSTAGRCEDRHENLLAELVASALRKNLKFGQRASVAAGKLDDDLHDVVNITYDFACYLKPLKSSSVSLLERVHFHRIIWDECQKAKSAKTPHLSATHRWIVSGTPIEKDCTEAASYLKFLGLREYSRNELLSSARAYPSYTGPIVKPSFWHHIRRPREDEAPESCSSAAANWLSKWMTSNDAAPKRSKEQSERFSSQWVDAVLVEHGVVNPTRLHKLCTDQSLLAWNNFDFVNHASSLVNEVFVATGLKERKARMLAIAIEELQGFIAQGLKAERPHPRCIFAVLSLKHNRRLSCRLHESVLTSLPKADAPKQYVRPPLTTVYTRCAVQNHIFARHMIRHLKTDVEKFAPLPERTERIVTYPLVPSERCLYERIERKIQESFRALQVRDRLGDRICRVMSWVAMLRRMVVHPSLVEESQAGVVVGEETAANENANLNVTEESVKEALERLEKAVKLQQRRVPECLLLALRAMLEVPPELPECVICTDSVQEPVLLQCHHMYCRECTLAVMRAPTEPRCPTCRATTLSKPKTLLKLGNGAVQAMTGADEEEWATLVGACGEGSKLQAVLSVMQEVWTSDQEAKFVVFSSFNNAVHRIQRLLQAHRVNSMVVDGSTPLKKRAALISNFQQPASDVKVCIITSRVGNAGLTLTAANHLILIEPSTNQTQELQAMARIHRFGQQKPVTVHRLVAADTVEERIVRAVALRRVGENAVTELKRVIMGTAE